MAQEYTGNPAIHTLLTAREVAAILQISCRKVLDLINDEEITASVIAGKFRIRKSDLEIYIDDNKGTTRSS